ncbi:unnamed protein product, partial [Prunus brigantina]
FVGCDQGRTLNQDLRQWMINQNPPDEVKVINGCDHMVMFSKSLELFYNLQKVAEC